MFALWIFIIMAILKLADAPVIGMLSWGWILLPFALAFAYFEFLEPWFGLDRKEDSEADKAKQAAKDKLHRSL